MTEPGWLADTRRSYDTVAAAYADFQRAALDAQPLVRGVLALFAERVGGVGGPVLDAGCGPGHLTAYLRDRGVAAFGVDLSPAMVELARRGHPGLRFEVGSMTGLDLADASVGAVLAFYSVIHVPDGQVPAVLGEFRRVLRPGGVLLLGFHVGAGSRLKTSGYGGHPMRVVVHRRPVERMAAWCREAGLPVEAQLVLDPGAEVPGGVLLATRPVG